MDNIRTSVEFEYLLTCLCYILFMVKIKFLQIAFVDSCLCACNYQYSMDVRNGGNVGYGCYWNSRGFMMVMQYYSIGFSCFIHVYHIVKQLRICFRSELYWYFNLYYIYIPNG